MGGQQKVTEVTSLIEGFAALTEFAAGASGYSYGILSEDNGLKVTLKTAKPCFGELRPYKSEITVTDGTLHSQKERAKDYHPGDLPHNFPTGVIHGIAIPMMGAARSSPVFKAFLDRDVSPWKDFLQKIEVSDKAYVVKDTDVGPSGIINMMMVGRYINDGWSTRFNKFASLRPEASPNVHLLATIATSGYSWGTSKPQISVADYLAYSLKLTGMSIPAFVRGLPYDLDGGAKLRDRAAYNRPWINDVFGRGHKNNLPFGKTLNTDSEYEALLDSIISDSEEPRIDNPAPDGTDLLKSCGDRVNAG